MDSGRVGVCHRLENKRRQFLIVVNDVVKNKFDTYTEIIEKDKANADFRFEKSKMFVRRALVRQRVLQQCMKMRRANFDRNPHKNLYGSYGGRSIEQFGREIETFIAMNHPKIRRQRKIRQLLEEGIEQGKILEEKAVMKRMKSFLQRSMTKTKMKDRQKERSQLSINREKSKINYQRYGIPKLPVLTNPFFTSNKQVIDNSAKKTTSVTLKPVEATKNQEVNILKLTGDLKNLDISDKRKLNKTDDQQLDDSSAKEVLKELGPDKNGISEPGPRTLMVLPPIKPKGVLVQN